MGGTRRSSRRRGLGFTLVGALILGLVPASAAAAPPSSAASTKGRVLLVGTFKGRKGGFTTIQAAVNAARPGDWILVAPGDYHEVTDAHATSDAISHGDYGGVYIDKPRLHLRGMNRNHVVVDGTNAGSSRCSADAAAQNLGPSGPDGRPAGRNGILVWDADGVSIENLTVCNFLAGGGSAGNEIWWNGGDGTGQIGLTGYTGRYLTATSTYFADPSTAAQYGIFASNAAGPGTWTTLYASNFADSGMYVGACLRVCGATITDAWMQFSALGYSGTNSGGSIVIQHSQFDHNKDGLDTNTQLNGDPPAPQDGSCPGNATSPITHTHSCWVFTHNFVHDNNNPNVPQSGTAAAGPTGTGMTLAGGRNDTVADNTFSNNGAWGVLFVPYPDSNPPSLNQTCAGTGGTENAAFGCVYDPQGNALLRNTFMHNAFFGNPGNVDFGEITLSAGLPRNCYAHNRAPKGSAPSNLEQSRPTCGPPSTTADNAGPLLPQVLCDTGFGTCPPDAKYPQSTGVVMQPLPSRLASMPDPCAGVPANPWC
jgi:hypothetical protein